jgi:NADH dehydrogenase FAD-containing subunit
MLRILLCNHDFTKTTKRMSIKKLVFLGAGHAHLYALAAFKKSPRIDTDIHLITPYDHVVYSAMVPGIVAGHYAADDCTISIPSLLDKTAIKIAYAACTGIDTLTQHIQMTNHAGVVSTLQYDVLSLDTGSCMDKNVIDQQIPGAKEHAVFVRPLEPFIKLWPQILEHAQTRLLRISVIGAGATGIELAMALQHQLPHCNITLVTGSTPPATGYSPSVQKRVLATLKKRSITVLQDSCVRMDDKQLYLASGASLACDMPILTIGGHPPAWLADSGLALDEHGYLAVNALQQSTSHPNVFAAGDIASRVDTPHAKSGVFAVRAGAALYHNLHATLLKQPKSHPLKAYPIVPRSLNLISCGNKTAIASWGMNGGTNPQGLTLQGHWVWRWKNVIDQRWLRLYKL